MRERRNEYKATIILPYLHGDAKHKYKANFIGWWSLIGTKRSFGEVFEWFAKEYANYVEPDDMIRSAIEARLIFDDLLSS